MGRTAIEWADAAWNVVTGCTPISAGCRNCWAWRNSKRLAANPTVRYRERYQGFKPTCWPERLEEPLHWREPRTVFVASMGDLFHEDVPFEFIDRVFAVMALCLQHTFLVLTKRPKMMLRYIHDSQRYDSILNALSSGFVWDQSNRTIKRLWINCPTEYVWPLPNVWLGVTAENQGTANKRISILRQTPAAMRFVSVEPMLEPVKLGLAKGLPGLDWVICGEESGPNARHVGDGPIRDLKNQCVAAGVPFMLKQMWIGGKLVKMPELDGRVWDQRPEVSP